MYNATNILLKHSNRQLAKKEIEIEVQPFYSFIGSAKSGRLTRELYLGLMLANYNYLRLINELCKLRLAKSDDDNLMLTLEFEIRAEKNQDKMAELLNNIGLEFERTGEWIVKDSDIESIKFEADNYKEALSVVNYGLYFKAVTAAQNWINQAKRKKPNENNTNCGNG